MAQSSIAQSDSVRFSITISNPSAITSYTMAGLPVFSSASINSILAAYYITEFKQAYPDARLQYLRNVYKVRCNSYALAAALNTANASLFPNYERIGSPVLCASYTPNDMNLWYTKYLKYINAEGAWGITKGDPNVVIGVTDTYFDMLNPDLYPKVARIGPNTPSTSSHGTCVAGVAACATDNGQGYPSIGFNCQLDLSNDWANDNEMLLMSKRGRRIINGSWLNRASQPTLNLRNYFYEQGLYNEVYENGTLSCFAAGNGEMTGSDPSYFCFPSSYDHVFSTTNVGWENNYPGTFNVKGVHETNVGSLSQCFQHNNRVDICAPAVRIGGLTYDPSDPTKHYQWADFWGTSCASPMVAGTAGLVQSALKQTVGFKDANYSPYQLEWILKQSADRSMLIIPENAPYVGRLGMGALNAQAAVEKVRNLPNTSSPLLLNPNDAATQTMYIKGIEINTICAPGFSSNGVKPKLTPIIVNGVAPFTYVWEEVPDGTNTAILDNENIAEPTIVGIKSGATTRVLYYRLTVYDNSKLIPSDAQPTAQKVAMKTFKVQLKTSGYDLAMRDSYVDMLNEPNDQRIFDPREWDTWTSPDIWNRQAFDGGTEHQNPEYFTTAANYAYTRVRNVGCTASPSTSKLRLYWSKASTGENWDADWTVTDVAAASGPPIAGGREITTGGGITIPVMQPGDVNIIPKSWFPPKPEDYAGTPSTFEVCFLARIEEATGMTIPELFYTGVGQNVRNNNNIVTRNMVLTNLRPDNIKTMKKQLIIANGNATATTYNFEFASERSVFPHFAGDFSSLGSVTLHLGDLYDVWVNSGSLGSVASSNAQARTVTFDGANSLHLDSLPLAANQRFTVEVEFTLDSPVVVNEVSNHVFHARQFEVSNPNEVYGAVNYQVTVSPSTQNNQRKALTDSISTGSTIQSFKVAPNPTSGIVRISFNGEKDNATELLVTDMVGKKIMTEKITFSPRSSKEINLSRFATGTYLINISNANGTNEVYKVVKE